MPFIRFSLVALFLFWGARSFSGEVPTGNVSPHPGQIQVLSGKDPIALFVFQDAKITRPYFAHVKLPGGPQLTRNHPPRPGDAQDHDLFHPGIWFAFGDISGSDNWRLKAKVETISAVAHSTEAGPGKTGTQKLVVKNMYFANETQKPLLTETCEYGFIPQEWGSLWIVDSTLTAAADCTFGDQMEEMGLGIRVATPLAVKSNRGGRILNSKQGVNEKETREKIADWCDYSGNIENQWVGVTLFAAPDNPRATWWHVRDYGFFTANPFHAHPDRKDNSPQTLKQGEQTRYRYGIALHGDRGEIKYEPRSAFEIFKTRLQE